MAYVLLFIDRTALNNLNGGVMQGNKWVRKSLGAALLAAGGLLASGASFAANYPDFTVDQNAVTGTALPPATEFVIADRLNGLYTESLTVTSSDGMGGGTFSSQATFAIGNYFNNDLLVPSALGCNLTTDCYNLYATLVATGSFATQGSGEVDFTGITGTINLYTDPNQDTTTNTSVPGGTTSDDQHLATSSSLIAGQGHFFPTLASGDFELVWNPITLVPPDGPAFFISPNPFYIQVDANGNFTENPLTTTVFSGSANAFFAPEPATLALLGLGLLGAGWARRRTRQ